MNIEHALTYIALLSVVGMFGSMFCHKLDKGIRETFVSR